MTPLKNVYIESGAELAPDGIPLHFGDLKAEYHAALNGAVLLDRSHEGRIVMTGRDRLDLLNRMSTNNFATMQPQEAKPTLFTTPNARLIDRIVVFNRNDDELLLLTGPGRGGAVQNYLQRNIFFNDDVKLRNLAEDSHQFTLHGPNAHAVMAALSPQAAEIDLLHGADVTLNGIAVFVGQLKPYIGSHWSLIVAKDHAADLWQAMMETGKAHGLHPAGGLTFHTLRIRAGKPGVGFELTGEYIPLELGLWDEVSFNKICYTGQEIIARMESRGKLARTIVRLELENFAKAGTELYHEGRSVGKVTSSVTSPDDEIFAIGIVKTAIAEAGTKVNIGRPEGETAQISGLLGVQPLTE